MSRIQRIGSSAIVRSLGSGLAYMLAFLRSRFARRSARLFATGFAALAIVFSLSFGALMIRLSQGPIEVDALGERIADGLTRRFNGAAQFGFGQTLIARTEHGPTITLENMKAVSDGRTVIAAPRAEVSLDPLALLRLDITPRRLQAFNLSIRMLILPDGAIAITAAENAESAIPVTPAPTPTAKDLATPVLPAGRVALLREAGLALRRFFDLATSPNSPLAALQSVAVKGGELIIDDRMTNAVTRFSDLALSFEKRGTSTKFALTALGANGVVGLDADATGTPSTQRTLNLEMRNISIDEIMLAASVGRPTIDSDALVSMKMRFVLDAAGSLHEANARFAVGSGFLRLEDPDHEPLFFDEITGGAHWDRANRHIVIDQTRFFAGATHFTAGGAIVPPEGSNQSWGLSFGLTEPSGFAPSRQNEKFLAVNKGGIEAKIDLQQKQFAIDKVYLEGPEVAASGQGVFDWTDGPHVRMTFNGGPMPVMSVHRIWPSYMGAPARDWIVTHLRGGVLESAKLSVDYNKADMLAMRFGRPPPDEAMSLDFQLSNASVAPIKGAPEIGDIDGAGRLTGRTAVFNATTGRIEPKTGKKLILSKATYTMPDNDGGASTPAHIEARVSGPMEAVAELLDAEAIKTYASLPLEPSQLKGQVDAKMRVDFKIGPDANGDDVKIFVNANVANFVIEQVIGKERFEAPNLNVVGDPSGIHATGAGRIFGAAATLDLRKNIAQPATAAIVGAIEEAARQKSGFPTPGIAGPISLKMNAVFTDKNPKVSVDLDFMRAAFDNPIPGLVKATGRPGRATFNLIEKESGGFKIDDLAFEAGGAAAKGSLDINANGDLTSAKITQARLSPGDDMRIEAQRAGDMVKVAVRGQQLDARPFLKNLSQANDGKAGKDSVDFELDLKMPILAGYGKQALVNADLKFTRKNGVFRAFALSGLFGRSQLAGVLARGDNGNPQINITTNDGGALLAFADLYPRMDGGALNATLHFEGKSLNGMVSIKKFILRDEPIMRRLISEGAPRTDQSGAVLVNPSLVQFDRLSVLLSRTGERLDLIDGLMNGPNIGLTVQGYIDSGRDTLALNGTFVPAFTINNFFSKIPVVGMLLGGDWNEGLFALNYKVSGRMSSPILSINPLSIAPGFLRKLFGALDGLEQQPSAPTSSNGQSTPAGEAPTLR